MCFVSSPTPLHPYTPTPLHPYTPTPHTNRAWSTVNSHHYHKEKSVLNL
ncbi:MAG: hypothetical protein ACRAVC_14180 [Trichormus sp.]